ncbi:hypothetical protein RvY_04309 [Ramazzottius varieornatus]|uniref:Uncharacterized protein n=1 Tax=Ramazzottius varieornatus TaxID=947166 RepID=A0A1D1UR76_RAMVA|nr:hypothetical protein RvY_04309 [Ramazzottius varieornatus]
MAANDSRSLANQRIPMANHSRTLSSYDHPHWNQFYENGDLPAPPWYPRSIPSRQKGI